MLDTLTSLPPGRNIDLVRWVVEDDAHRDAESQGQSAASLPAPYTQFNEAEANMTAWLSGSAQPVPGEASQSVPFLHPQNWFEGDTWNQPSALDGQEPHEPHAGYGVFDDNNAAWLRMKAE